MSYWKIGHRLQNGQYTIEKILGSGGAGITYRAKEETSGRVVAIKTLNALIQSQPDFVKQQEKFIQEAFLLARCHHDYVIHVNHVFQEGELWCMVMEYIAGGNLREYVNHKGALSENEALRYIQQIGDALSYIHQQGFLHRDVKPANIMLRQNTLEAVLIDFGLARDFIQDKTQTHTNSRTESFAPIEQYEICAKRGAYTDVYALAATLYYILTLQLPFPAEFRQQGASLIPPKQHNPKISERVNSAILKGMELKPEQRPQSVQAWLKLLQAKTTLLKPENSSITPSSQISQSSRSLSPPLKLAATAKAIPEVNPKSQDIQFISAAGINYTSLHELLLAAKWKEADRETARIMLKVVGREKEGWLDSVDIEQFPCEELRTLDRLWLQTSNQRFGFSIQKRLYSNFGGTQKYNSEIWRNFGDRVGWRQNGHWLSYKDLNFTLWAPEGHLPMLGLHIWGFTGWISVLVSRLEVCQLGIVRRGGVTPPVP